MPQRSIRILGVLSALSLFACGEQGEPQRPVPWAPPSPEVRAPTGVGNPYPFGNGLPPNLTGTPFGESFGPLFSPPAATGRVSTLFSTPVQADRPTPAISGGTLAAGASMIVASDPDRDLIYLIDATLDRVDTLELALGEEPGRVAIQGERAFVALRSAGALLTVDLRQRRVSQRLQVCAAPRGVSFDGAESRVLVACAGGDLVAVSADGTRVLARARVAPDLRDVGRDAQGVWVSQYRSAKLLRLDSALRIMRQQRPADVQRQGAPKAAAPVAAPVAAPFAAAVAAPPVAPPPAVVPQGPSGPFLFPTEAPPPSMQDQQRIFEFHTHTPTLAWRTVAGPSGEPFMLHQRAQSTTVGSEALPVTGYYGVPPAPIDMDPGFCDGKIVHTTISRFGNAQVDAQRALPKAVVPVDLSISPSGRRVAVVAPGNFLRQYADPVLGQYANPAGPDAQQLYLFDAEQLARAASSDSTLQGADCMRTLDGAQHLFPGEATAVQFLNDETLLVQVRSPAELHVLRYDTDGSTHVTKVALSSREVRDTGHQVFHQNTGTGIACASCHGEALDDGHVWTFARVGARRTQHLRGGVLQTPPYHWAGDLGDLGALLSDVYVTRMSGVPLSPDAVYAVWSWLGSLPNIPGEAGDAARVARGRALFASEEVGCATCHAGESLRSAGNFDVGSGGSFKVPSLHGISLRLPLMHNGCADTLEKRFDPACGGSKHGATAQLSAQQLGDLIAYLATL